MRQTSRDKFFLRAMLTDAWSAVMVRRTRSVVRRSGVIIHDPDARKPRDLDDPFIDPEVQQRIGNVIARTSSARK
jgi:hypothetical protein